MKYEIEQVAATQSFLVVGLKVDYGGPKRFETIRVPWSALRDESVTRRFLDLLEEALHADQADCGREDIPLF